MDKFGFIYILLADDECEDPNFLGMISPMIAHLQYSHPKWRLIREKDPKRTIQIITDHAEFIKKLKEEKSDWLIDEKAQLDLILLDIEFPNHQNGLEVAEAICKQKANLPIIFFSQHEDPEVIINALTGETGEVLRAFPNKDYCTKKDILILGDYVKLEKKIEKYLELTGRFKNDYGILITHGTDTMAWGFAILRYALKNIKCNIVLTGSQMPLQGFYSPSDAIGNLRTALLILTRFSPPGVYVVFNNGKTIFLSHLIKVRKWDFDAFCGKIIGRVIWEDIKVYGEEGKTIPVSVHPEPHLERLYLLRTGGTIESEKDPVTGTLRATGDFVGAYLNTTLAKDFVKGDILNCYPSLKKDSSYLTLEHWKQVCNWVCEIETKEREISEKEKKNEEESKKGVYCDFNFDCNVKVVITNPFFTTDDYKQLFNNAGKGIILLGYGAGNANIDPIEKHNWSILPALESIKDEKIIVVSSQVPFDTYDFDYEAGRLLLENGAIPSGTLSYPECQVKLAYILGHEKEIKSVAKKYKLTEIQLIKAAFLAGVEFRKDEKKREYERITQTQKGGPPIKILPNDPFANPKKSFDEALEEVAKAQQEMQS
ncbi:MAG: asparaginase domain-containing protein [candidate division WOR-3 bacterium]